MSGDGCAQGASDGHGGWCDGGDVVRGWTKNLSKFVEKLIDVRLISARHR
jgi:hypothetical protein